MGKRPKRQVILVIVEGQTDENMLSVALSELFEEVDENIELVFAKLRDDDDSDIERGGDITTKYGITPEKIEKVINKMAISQCLQDYGLYAKDISEVIQIVDLDGAFISDESIQFGDVKTTRYEADAIITSDVLRIADRNQRKRDNLNHLISMNEIGIRNVNKYNQTTTKTVMVPYHVFYFASNIDHFVHNDANLETYQKKWLSDEFAREAGNSAEDFCAFVAEHTSATAGMSYADSWAFAREGTNSLGRHSNINVLINMIRDKGELTA